MSKISVLGKLVLLRCRISSRMFQNLHLGVLELTNCTVIRYKMPFRVNIICVAWTWKLFWFVNLQAESVLASISGKNVVVATMTSSGKSLCYNLPVLEELSHNLSSCALYLFPTKVCIHVHYTWRGCKLIFYFPSCYVPVFKIEADRRKVFLHRIVISWNNKLLSSYLGISSRPTEISSGFDQRIWC